MSMLNKVVGVAVGLLLVGILVPMGISEIVGANTTGWGDTLITVFTILLPILGIIGLALYFMPRK